VVLVRVAHQRKTSGLAVTVLAVTVLAVTVLAVTTRSTTVRLSARMPAGTILRFMRPLPPTRGWVVMV
jgi:uncharacterized membrane protein YwaF